jgi:hypothetical protein
MAEFVEKPNFQHGHRPKSGGSPTYRSWCSMKLRCHNPGTINYKDYGGRGITICDRWQKFQGFLKDMGPRPPGMSLERINPDGNYEPGNCKWATPLEQRVNQRPRKRLEEWSDQELISELMRRKNEHRGYALLLESLIGATFHARKHG